MTIVLGNLRYGILEYGRFSSHLVMELMFKYRLFGIFVVFVRYEVGDL